MSDPDKKHLKRMILDEKIGKQVRENAGDGGLARKDERQQRWHEMGDFSCFGKRVPKRVRDTPHEERTSSAYASIRKRKLENFDVETRCRKTEIYCDFTAENGSAF